MKTIVITGPSGSGKTYLSNKLSKLFCNTIVIKTDSYYRNNILIRVLSQFLYDIYDRPLSIKKNEIEKTLRSIHIKDRLITLYKYDFKRKSSSKSKKLFIYKGDNQFIILEGIFAHRLDINYEETINIMCEEEKEICSKRRLRRDQIERGRSSREVNRKFNKSWDLFYQNSQNYQKANKVLIINPKNKLSYDKLVFSLKNLKNNNQEK